MNTARFLKLIVGSAVIVAILVAFQASNTKGSTKDNNLPSAGMGDLHRLEAGASIPKTGGLNESRSAIGMGDLHRLEVQKSSQPFTGMGDLHRFEGQGSNQPAAGMGDLQRFDAQHQALK